MPFGDDAKSLVVPASSDVSYTQQSQRQNVATSPASESESE